MTKPNLELESQKSQWLTEEWIVKSQTKKPFTEETIPSQTKNNRKMIHTVSISFTQETKIKLCGRRDVCVSPIEHHMSIVKHGGDSIMLRRCGSAQ